MKLMQQSESGSMKTLVEDSQFQTSTLFRRISQKWSGIQGQYQFKINIMLQKCDDL